MRIPGDDKQSMRVLITVKTYPIPSATYDELVCTAGVTADGDFVRLYPINFRDLPFSQQYKKYQWIDLTVSKHQGRDSRKESYRPEVETIRPYGNPIPSNPGNWTARSEFVYKNRACSMEDLWDQRLRDKTSLGIFRPKKVKDLKFTPDESDWKPRFKDALNQVRLWETRTESLKNPPRKVPYKFRYQFECDDSRCNGHNMMIEDWEVGALFWRLVDQGKSHERAAQMVREKFLDVLCGPDKDTHFFVGTILNYPSRWVVIGVYYPKKEEKGLFD